MRHLLSKVNAAKRAGIDKATITRKTKEGEELFPALVDGKIDVGHPAFKAFLEKRGVDPNSFPAFVPPVHTEIKGIEDDGSPQVMTSIQELPLREIGERFGGVEEFTTWLKSIKLSEEIREKRLKNDETDGSMIERELVQSHVFGFIDEVSRRLLSDTAKTLTRVAYANAKGGMEIEKAERETREIIAKTIGPLKRRVSKSIKDAGTASSSGDQDKTLEKRKA